MRLRTELPQASRTRRFLWKAYDVVEQILLLPIAVAVMPASLWFWVGEKVEKRWPRPEDD